HHKDGQKHDTRPENIAVLCVACHAEQFNHSHIKGGPDYVEFLRLRPSILAGAPTSTVSPPAPASTARSASSSPQLPLLSSAPPRPNNWVAAAQELARTYKLGVQDLRKDGGCVWVALKHPSHPAAFELKKLGFQFSPKRQAFWRKD
ncbi:MAG: hypothetical protein IAF94_20060, partial [Pirellulaceae bacterium]|nr:hypothetical protein [Pirellulaceae bacterium]